MTLRRFIAAASAAVLFLSSSPAFARPVSDIVDHTAATVARATFISWSLDVLDIDRSTADCTLPFTRYPKGLKPALCAAQDRGALDAFLDGAVYTLGQPVTRGEAIVVLTALTGERKTDSDATPFRDVRTEREKEAVRNALSLKWMLPLRPSLFGVARQLSGSEALSLLQAVVGDVPAGPRNITITIGSRPVETGTLPKQGLLDAVWQILQRDFLHSDKLSEEEAAYSAAEAIVKSAGDPYTTFFRPIGADNFAQQLKGELSGIGAQVEDKSGVITVVSPIPGSPAERAGIRPGDEILTADGHELTGIGVDRAVQYIRGERGTTVKLTIRRSGVEIQLSVVRDTISIPEISVSWQGDIAVVQLVQFGETTDKKIRSIFTDIVKKSPRGVILDLRNNGGGLLTAADTVCSVFMPRGTVVAKVKSASDVRLETTQEEPILSPSTKVVVLVNKGSASASEIVAGALQDHKRATIVGTQTFGKGTVQEVLSFPSGEALKITIAEWLTPLERRLNGEGVKPDVIVTGDASGGGADDQMRRALDILR